MEHTMALLRISHQFPQHGLPGSVVKTGNIEKRKKTNQVAADIEYRVLASGNF
jgi:hypothetical protein